MVVELFKTATGAYSVAVLPVSLRSDTNTEVGVDAGWLLCACYAFRFLIFQLCSTYPVESCGGQFSLQILFKQIIFSHR